MGTDHTKTATPMIANLVAGNASTRLRRAAPLAALNVICAPFTPLELKKAGAAGSSIIRLADGALMTAE